MSPHSDPVEKITACANYIFIGAPRKSQSPGAVLGFHGGLTGSPLPRMAAEDYPLIAEADLATARQQIAALYQEESAFFARIGFNPALINKSFELTKLENSETRFYFPSLATLRSAGVTGVQNYAYPASEQQLHAVELEVGRDLPGLNLVSDI